MRSKVGWLVVVGLVALVGWWWRANARKEGAALEEHSTAPSAAHAVGGDSQQPPANAAADSSGSAETASASTDDVATPPDDADATRAAVSPTATLRVRVVANETGAPLAGIEVNVRPDPLESGWSTTSKSDSKGGEHDSLVTDADGRVEFELTPGSAWQVFGDSPRFVDTAPLAGGGRESIEVLAAGTTRELELRLPTGADLHFCGRVVAEEDGAPLAGARIRRSKTLAGEAPVLVTDADGRFEVQTASWLESKRFTVKLAGRAERTAYVREGHETAERAFVVHLARTASLTLTVRDPNGAGVPSAEVTATTSRFSLQEGSSDVFSLGFDEFDQPDPTWNVVLDDAGRGEFVGLPPKAPLTLEVSRDGDIVWSSSEPIVLEPAESKALEIVVGLGTEVSGLVVDSNQRPVPAVTIWLTGSNEGVRPYFESYQEPTMTAVSDANGRFSFAKVPAGTWQLGPAADRLEEGVADANAIAPATQALEIAPAATRVEATVVVHRGLYVSGRVLDENGEPAAGAGIETSDGGPWPFRFDDADEEGRFVIGPLKAGNVELQAGGFSDDVFATGEPVTANVGSTDVVLRVRTGATIVGRVVDDASGELSSASLSYRLVRDDGELRGATQTGTEGEFELTGLDPGHYVLGAREGNLVGNAEVDAGAGRKTEPVVLRLTPAATLVVEWQGSEDTAEVTVKLGATEVEQSFVSRNNKETLFVPPGELTIEWAPLIWSEDANQAPTRGAPQSKSVHLAAGESARLDLGEAP